MFNAVRSHQTTAARHTVTISYAPSTFAKASLVFFVPCHISAVIWHANDSRLSWIKTISLPLVDDLETVVTAIVKAVAIRVAVATIA